MAPEQVRREPAESRSDIFAFGCVLYEMLAGRRAFARSTSIETMSAILADEPLPLPASGAFPSALGLVAQRCLETEPADRFQSAQDLAFALEALAGASAAALPEAPSVVARPMRRSLVAAGLLGAAALVAAFLLRAGIFPAPSEVPDPGSLEPLTTDPGYEGDPTFSPDGQTIACVSDRDGNFEIYLQQVAGGPAIDLTRDGADDVQPAFSPDGRQIAFVSSRGDATDVINPSPRMPPVGGDIWVMPALGGSARKIAENGNYPSWSPDGETIVFTHGTFRQSRLALVPVAGGAPRDLPLTGVSEARLRVPPLHESRTVMGRNALARAFLVGTRRALRTGAPPHVRARRPRGARRLARRTDRRLRGGRGVGERRGAPVRPGVGPRHRPPEGAHRGEQPDRARPPFAGRIRGRLRRDERGVLPRLARRPARTPRTAHVRPERPGRRAALVARRRLHRVRAAARRRPGRGEGHLDHEAGRRGGAAGRRRRRGLMLARGRPAPPSPARGDAPRRRRRVRGRDPVARDRRQDALHARPVGDLDRHPDRHRRQRRHRGRPVRRRSPAARRRDTPRGLPPVLLAVWPVALLPRRPQGLLARPGPAQGWRAAPPEKETDFPEAGLYLEDPHPSRDGRRIFFTRNRTVADLWILSTADAGTAEP